MTTIEAYKLAMALVVRGYVPAPCRNGEPMLRVWGMPSEGEVRRWAGDLGATEIGIVDLESGVVTVVDSVPLSAAELEARRVAQEAELAARRKADKSTKTRLEREADRRARGVPTRAEWLAARTQDKSEPWKKFPMSRAKWYRLGKPAPETGGVESPYPGLHVRSAQSPNIKTGEKTGGAAK